MFCSRCGKQVEEGNRFCQACGQEVGTAVTAAPTVASAAPPPPMASSPVAPAPTVPYAGFWVRFVAAFVDGLIIGIPAWLVVIGLVLLFGGFGAIMRRRAAPVDPQAAMALFGPMMAFLMLGMVVFLILEWLYFASMESSARQATFGKSVMSVRVTDYDGRRISFGHASGRFFSKLITGMIPFGIGYIMAGFTAKKQALHDLIAGTLVMKS